LLTATPLRGRGSLGAPETPSSLAAAH
jgi:hypothetical protein